MTLVSRYVLRETFGAWLVVTAVLFLILMSNQFAGILGDAADDELPRDAVFTIFGLTSLRSLVQITPIALFLGVMLALARLNRDGEMAALAACGIGPRRLLVPIGGLSLVLATVTAWLALVQTPVAVERIESIKAAASEALGVLQPGKFMSRDEGRAVMHAAEVEGSTMRGVFLERSEEEGITLVLAESGEQRVDAETGNLSVALFNGRVYRGVPGERSWSITSFREHVIPIWSDEAEEDAAPMMAKPTLELARSTAPLDRAELQWRMSFPISVIVLGLLAVPLSRSAPREGRYARLGMGLLIYITYANALLIARFGVENEKVPGWLGMWWTHALLATFAVLLLVRASGWGVRTPRAAPA